MTKASKTKMQSSYKQWQNSTATELWQVYGNYSIYKAQAYCRIKEYMQKVDGYGLRILGHNSMQFTCAYIATIDGVKKFIVETAKNTYAINLDELTAQGDKMKYQKLLIVYQNTTTPKTSYNTFEIEAKTQWQAVEFFYHTMHTQKIDIDNLLILAILTL